MSSTLPRTRSVSAASSSSSAASGSKERVRPVSLCDTSWARMTGQDLRQQNLVRTPSQANNLSTTVPQSLVVQNLGGRHTPTRSSLRHSRMIVLAKNGQKLRDRRWPPNSLGRVGVLVVTAQILVGVMAVTLATWFLMWAPSLSFKEVPHYAGVPVFLAGVFGAILISCFQRRRQRSIANIIKGILVALCCISIVTCLSVCIFTALHLAYLAPMTCHTRHSTITHPPSSEDILASTKNRVLHGDIGLYSTTTTSSPARKDKAGILGYDDDEDEAEGSGLVMRDLHAPDDYVDERILEFETVTLQTVTVKIENEIVLNVSSCECESQGADWVRTLTYPELSCLEVNNLLPVLFVASCVVTAVGAVLSALVLYLLWSFRNSFYGPAKPHETRPFIFTSNFNKSKTKAAAVSRSRGVTNGEGSLR
ncbi:uncharacterized protein LOC122252050 isoform X2 [Penaeus japonicus]|nr:uncharacterized protein LOC122252050 isoform X2 [Penaeus japonicus]XP_042870234.1 uncharacterized protein LOC122252050 isoform X2 [Penaeus japonicus]XP_042870235.1 uncharacterized protein LOC122252050 isoform X2 [Penaeus japonicus]XP_042870236.1 uncharacterized protein LOC122252050 isoform X2 [Penaeus japonicus]XP_042870237.1 uncharacterized protein LOC122252050 isoform X2 [Penaeus japonicus]